MTTDPKATAILTLRATSAGIGIATAAIKTGPYSWIGTLAQTATEAAAALLEAEPTETPQGRGATLDALQPVLDSIPKVSRADSEALALGIVTAIRVVRKWSA